MQVNNHCKHVLLGAGDDGELKMAKRSRDEFEVSEVSCMSPSAKIHASLSPMKPSQSNPYSYFDGQITDCPFVSVFML